MAEGLMVNWPPTLTTPWPDIQSSDLESLWAELQSQGWTRTNPTNAERTQYFRDARCTWGDTVTGSMLISPAGVRYPFAVCTNAGHREFLLLWPPYYSPPPGPLPGA